MTVFLEAAPRRYGGLAALSTLLFVAATSHAQGPAPAPAPDAEAPEAAPAEAESPGEAADAAPFDEPAGGAVESADDAAAAAAAAYPGDAAPAKEAPAEGDGKAPARAGGGTGASAAPAPKREGAAPPSGKEPPAKAAKAPKESAEVEAPALPFDGVLGSHQSFWQLQLGYQARFLGASSYDPFDDNDLLDHPYLTFSRTILATGPLAVAAFVSGDYGTSEASARGQATSFSLLRVEVGPELRYYLHHRLYGFGRLGVGGIHQAASIEESATAATLESTDWGFSLSGSLGLAGQIIGPESGRETPARVWLLGEVGYAWSPDGDLRLEAGESAPQRVVPLDLGTFSLASPQFRLGAAVTF